MYNINTTMVHTLYSQWQKIQDKLYLLKSHKSVLKKTASA